MKFGEAYFHTIAITSATAFLLAFSGVANADTVRGEVTDHYKTIIDQKPYKVEVCKDVTVSGDKTGDALKGAIIGGIIGNNVGDVENGGALGAVIGGMIGHNNSNATGGTKRVCSVETRYQESSREVYSHSIVRFWHDGQRIELKFHK